MSKPTGYLHVGTPPVRVDTHSIEDWIYLYLTNDGRLGLTVSGRGTEVAVAIDGETWNEIDRRARETLRLYRPGEVAP